MQGTVKKITEKNARGKTYFGLVLENNDELYRCGNNRPNCSVGDWVEFQVNNTAWGPFVKDGTLTIASAGTPTTTNHSNYVDKDKYWANKEIRDIENQKRISFNGARNSAIAFVELALANGAITLGSGKAAAKFEVLEEIVNKVTDDYYIQFQTKYKEIESSMFTQEELETQPQSEEDNWKNS